MTDPLVEALRRLVEREGGYQKVADTVRVNDQSIYQIVAGVKLPSGNPKGVGPKLRAKLTAAYPDWLEPRAYVFGLSVESAAGQVKATGTHPPIPGVAQPLILDKFTVPSTRTIDELKSMSELPPSFRLHAPDDALAPKVPRGMPLIMAASSMAKPDQVILVRDSAGELHLRRYGQGIGGNWRARATNDAYLTLEAERDGLQLLAVLKWVDGEAF